MTDWKVGQEVVVIQPTAGWRVDRIARVQKTWLSLESGLRFRPDGTMCGPLRVSDRIESITPHWAALITRKENWRAVASSLNYDENHSKLSNDQIARMAEIVNGDAARKELVQAREIARKYPIENVEQAPSVLWLLEMLSREYEYLLSVDRRRPEVPGE